MPGHDEFEIFMIDPPWKIQKGGIRKVRPKQGKALDYTTLPLADIFQLLDREIFSHAANHHCVFLWTIDQYLVESDQRCSQEDIKDTAGLSGIRPMAWRLVSPSVIPMNTWYGITNQNWSR